MKIAGKWELEDYICVKDTQNFVVGQIYKGYLIEGVELMVFDKHGKRGKHSIDFFEKVDQL